MLTIPHCKESLSRAYVTAVVGRARHSISWCRDFDYGVDGTVFELASRGNRIRETGLGFDFQSKTTVDWSLDGADVVYDLEADAYNNLVERGGTTAFPFLLILLCLPRDDSQWLDVTPGQLVMQKCAYWCKVNGTLTPNSATTRVRIPSANVFSPAAVGNLLNDIKAGILLP
jgi:hypothetical protein